MWRALAVARGELVVYLDSDTADFSPQFATGLLGPLICEPDVRFVKAHYRRPFTTPDGSEHAAGGGRVNELTARPLLSAFFPELAAFAQPLAGEVAARRDFFERLPFATGYAVETAMLLHAYDALGGTDAMAQVDLDVRRNRHQPLRGPRARWPARCWVRCWSRLAADGPAARRRARGAGRAAAVRDPRRSRVVGIRCIYTDLDGTLLGRDASLFRTAEGEFTLLAARALEACHRAGAEVVIASGRRRAQVMEDARLIGQTAYIFEVGAGLVIDGETTFLTGELQPREGETVHAQIAAGGAPEVLIRHYAGRLEPHAPFHLDREVSHLFRGLGGRRRGQRAARPPRGTPALRLVDNGEIAPDTHTFHLIPAEVSKARAVAAHMRARGYAREECVAVGDSREDLEVAERGRPPVPRLERRGRGHERVRQRGAHGSGDG